MWRGSGRGVGGSGICCGVQLQGMPAADGIAFWRRGVFQALGFDGVGRHLEMGAQGRFGARVGEPFLSCLRNDGLLDA